MYSPKLKERKPDVVNPDPKSRKFVCPDCALATKYRVYTQHLIVYIEIIDYKQLKYHFAEDRNKALCGFNIKEDNRLKIYLWKKLLNTLYGITRLWL